MSGFRAGSVQELSIVWDLRIFERMHLVVDMLYWFAASNMPEVKGP